MRSRVRAVSSRRDAWLFLLLAAASLVLFGTSAGWERAVTDGLRGAGRVAGSRTWIGLTTLFFVFGTWRRLFARLSENGTGEAGAIGRLGMAAALSIGASASASIYGASALARSRTQAERLRSARTTDALAAPVCALSPFNQWGAFFVGLIAVQPSAAPPVWTLIGSLPFNLYSVVLLTLLSAWSLRAGGARRRPAAARQPLPPGQAVMILAVLSGTGLAASRAVATGSGRETVAWLVIGAAAGCAWGRRHAGPGALRTAAERAFRPALSASVFLFAILLLRSALGEGSPMPLPVAWSALPATSAYVGAAFVSVLTGSSWTAAALMMPIALATAGADAPLLVGATIAGSVLGDHLAPHSDTSIMTAAATQVRLADHVRHQLPLGLAAAGAALLGYVALDIHG